MTQILRGDLTVALFRCLVLFWSVLAVATAEPTPNPSPSPSASPETEEKATPTPPLQPEKLPQSILPARVDLEALETLPIFSEGHVESFFVFCTQRLEAIAGSATYDGSIYGELSALTVIVSLWMNPESWNDQPLIALKDPQLRQLLELPGGGTRAAYSQLNGKNRLPELIADARCTLEREGAGALSPLQNRVLALAGRIEAFQGIRAQSDLRFVPPVNGGPWMTVNQAAEAYAGPLGKALPDTVLRMKRAFKDADPFHFESALHAFVDTLVRLNPANYPSPGSFSFEVWIAKADLGWWAGFVLAVAALIIMLTFQRRRGAGYVISCGLCVIGGVLLLAEIIGESRIQHANFFVAFVRSPYLLPLLIASSGLLLELCWRTRYALLAATVVSSVLLFLRSFSLI